MTNHAEGRVKRLFLLAVVIVAVFFGFPSPCEGLDLSQHGESGYTW